MFLVEKQAHNESTRRDAGASCVTTAQLSKGSRWQQQAPLLWKLQGHPSLPWLSREGCCLLGAQIRDLTVGLQTPLAISHCSGFRWALVVPRVWDPVKVQCASQREYVNNKMGRSTVWKEFLLCIYGGSGISLDSLNYNLLLAINSGTEFQDAYSILTTIIF